jgi:hypothetical protein
MQKHSFGTNAEDAPEEALLFVGLRNIGLGIRMLHLYAVRSRIGIMGIF